MSSNQSIITKAFSNLSGSDYNPYINFDQSETKPNNTYGNIKTNIKDSVSGINDTTFKVSKIIADTNTSNANYFEKLSELNYNYKKKLKEVDDAKFSETERIKNDFRRSGISTDSNYAKRTLRKIEDQINERKNYILKDYANQKQKQFRQLSKNQPIFDITKTVINQVFGGGFLPKI